MRGQNEEAEVEEIEEIEDVVEAGDDDNNRTERDPPRPQNCVTSRDRFSWRKWIICWRKVEKMNETRRAALEEQNKLHKYRPDRMETWTPTWKKYHGDRWVFCLLRFEEEYNCWEEREHGKRDCGGRPPFVEYNDPDDDEIWENMSDPHQVYSDDESYDSGLSYNSSF